MKPLSFVIGLMILVSSCDYNHITAQKTINDYMEQNLLRPSTYNAHFDYSPSRIKITKKDAELVNSSLKDRNVEPFDGWCITVNISADDKNGIKREQCANFYLNKTCDSVISTDVVSSICKE